MKRPFFSSKYTVKQVLTKGQIIDHVWVEGAPTDKEIWATIQPLTARELRDLPEGLRTRAKFACFTYSKLTSYKVGGPVADKVVVNGVEWEVNGGYEDGDFSRAPIKGYDYILAEPEL